MISKEHSYEVDLGRQEAVESFANPPIASFSYSHRYSPVRLTTEIRLLTKGSDLINWKAHSYAGRLNKNDATLVADCAMPHPIPSVFSLNVSSSEPAARYASAPGMTEDFSLAALGPIDKTEAPEVSDPRLALPEAVQVPFANSCVSSAVVSEMTERLNASTVELPQRGSNTRLFLEQLREMAQAHLIDLARAAASIRDEIDALTRTMSQRREAVWAAAVPVRGRIPGEEAQSGVAAEVVDSELDTVESLTLPLAKEPMIRRGILSVCLETPYELIGQLAAVLLTMRSEEFALGIVSIEHGAVGTGKLDLSVDLASIDVTPRDGVIPPMALRVVVREHPTASERNAWGNVKRGHPSSKRGGAGG